ncbi:hypothetical protein [Pseudomonas sp. CLCA07]
MSSTFRVKRSFFALANIVVTGTADRFSVMLSNVTAITRQRLRAIELPQLQAVLLQQATSSNPSMFGIMTSSNSRSGGVSEVQMANALRPSRALLASC